MSETMRKLIYLVVVCFFFVPVKGQNPAYARKVVDTLCSPWFAGRGYLKDGDLKAAEYIKAQFTEAGLKPFGSSYFQKYGFTVNVFPTDPDIYIDGERLTPGLDFIPEAGCRTLSGTFELVWVDSQTIDDPRKYKKLVDDTRFRRSFLVLNNLNRVKEKTLLRKMRDNEFKAAGIIEVVTKLMWSVATRQDMFPSFQIRPGHISPSSKLIKVDVFSQISTHQTQNVAGFIKGLEKPDSFIVFTAHYDHLGMIGKSVYFPGANDNASGVAMLLDLASYYATHKPKYSVAFIAFAGEEAGLLGSYYYTQNPLFNLKSIRFLINMDLMGTGSKGITAVNATVYPDFFNKLEIANTAGNYLSPLNQRGKAQNSDHYFFSEMGVPCFFFYLMGDYPYYHDPDDKAEKLPMEKYTEAFLLIRDFVTELETP